MDERTLSALEFPRVLEQLSHFCLSEAGKNAVLKLYPKTSLEEVIRQRNLYDELRAWLSEGEFSPVSFPDLSDLFEVLKTNSHPITDIEALWALKNILNIAEKAVDSIHAGSLRRPILDAEAVSFPLPDLTISALRRCVNDDGFLKDESSPGLYLVRNEIRSIHRSCLKKVHEYAERYNIAHYLQDDFMTLSSDRYVLPLKANFKGRIQGIVHDYSKTGETLYFEPLFLVEQNNKLQELKQSEREEERKVFAMITELILQEFPQIQNAWQLLITIDVGQALCAFASAIGGRCVGMKEGIPLNIHGARHPLLLLDAEKHKKDSRYNGPRQVMPLDFVLREKDRILVMSGGNAGGKTVALKTLGLMTVMTLSGIPIPVERDGDFPFLTSVYAFIGDEQSLEGHVSTFTGQIHHLSDIWDKLDEYSLVLLDEFGAGTEPSQGAALAQAVLDGMLEKRCYAMAATHFPALKSYALTHDGVRAASVLFDSQTRKPLFRIAYDQVGSSQTMDVAREHGLPESVIKQAERYLLLDGNDTAAILERLNILAKEREEEIEKYRAAEKKLHEKRLAFQETMKKELARLDEEIREKSRELFQDYKAGKISAKQAQKEMAKLRTQIVPEENKSEETEQNPALFVPGTEVLHKGWNKKAVVLALDAKSGKAKIDINGVSMWAPLSSLESKGTAAVIKGNVVTKISKPASYLQIDLRGKRADVALTELEQFLDRSLLAGSQGVEVIHGRGTGVLRKAVHELLRNFPGVDSYELCPEGQGGDGATRVLFR